MFGLDDPWIMAAYLLCLASTAICFIYGLVFWNRGDDAPEEPPAEERQWAEEETKLEEGL